MHEQRREYAVRELEHDTSIDSQLAADFVADAMASTWSSSYASRWKHHADKGAVVSQRWP